MYMQVKKICLIIVASLFFANCTIDGQTKRVLVFSKTTGYRHESIETGVKAIKTLGVTHAFDVDATEDVTYFNSDSLKKYNAIIFLNTTEDIFNKKQEESFKKYIQAGGGFVGIHAAADTEYKWPWYGKLVGAYFESHPPGLHQANIHIKDTTHLSTKSLPKVWSHNDEWYNYKTISPDIKILANLDETSYTGGTNGKNHPISWYQEYDGGKMFYTGLGHPKEAYKDANFLAHLLGGIQYVIAD